MDQSPKPAKTEQRKEAKTPKNGGKRGKRLIDPSDALRGVKKALDQILLEAQGLPEDVRSKLVAARDAAWQEFVKAEEALNSAAR